MCNSNAEPSGFAEVLHRFQTASNLQQVQQQSGLLVPSFEMPEASASRGALYSSRPLESHIAGGTVADYHHDVGEMGVLVQRFLEASSLPQHHQQRQLPPRSARHARTFIKNDDGDHPQ